MLFDPTALDRMLLRKMSGEHGRIVIFRTLTEYIGGLNRRVYKLMMMMKRLRSSAQARNVNVARLFTYDILNAEYPSAESTTP